MLTKPRVFLQIAACIATSEVDFLRGLRRGGPAYAGILDFTSFNPASFEASLCSFLESSALVRRCSPLFQLRAQASGIFRAGPRRREQLAPALSLALGHWVLVKELLILLSIVGI